MHNNSVEATKEKDRGAACMSLLKNFYKQLLKLYCTNINITVQA